MDTPLKFDTKDIYWDRIENRLREILPRSSNRYMIDADTALRNLKMMRGCVVNERWFIAYDVGTPWFSTKTVLSEQTILRFGEGGSFREVISALKHLARENGCEHIVAGNFFSPDRERTARLYAMHGFRPCSNGLIMEA